MFSKRVNRIFNIDPLIGANPLIPFGQKVSVIKIKLILDIGLPDVEFYLMGITERIAVYFRANAHLYPAYALLCKLRAVNIEPALILVDPAGVGRVLSFRALCLYRKLKRFINIISI